MLKLLLYSCIHKPYFPPGRIFPRPPLWLDAITLIAAAIKHFLPINLFPPRLQKLPLPCDSPVPQPHMLPCAHPQQDLNQRPARRSFLRRRTIWAKTPSGSGIGRIRVPRAIPLSIDSHPLILGVRTLFTLHHARIFNGTHVCHDARRGGVHVDGLHAEVGAGVRGAGVVGGEDGQFHLLVQGEFGASDEPDVAGAKHAVGGGEEVGAQAF